MTAKEKAESLYIDMLSWQDNSIEYLERDIISISAKQCALIAIDLRLDGDFLFTSIEYGIDSLEYWKKVKQEIENL